MELPLPVPEEVVPLSPNNKTHASDIKIDATIIGHGLLILLVLYFSYQLVSSPSPWIFLDALNLLIHEAGHLIFLPFGEFMHILGGSLFQTLFPVCFLVYFIRRKEYFSSAFILFWIADNIINVSVYMRDAQVMQLPLLGGDGVIHDWNWLFTYMGVLGQTGLIGGTFFFLGVTCLVLSILGMIWFTAQQMRQ